MDDRRLSSRPPRVRPAGAIYTLLLLTASTATAAATASTRARARALASAFLPTPTRHLQRRLPSPLPPPPVVVRAQEPPGRADLDPSTAPLEEQVAAIEALLDTYLYPQEAAETRKTLAFESQDRFVGSEGSGQRGSSNAAAPLTKPHLTYGEFPLGSVARLLAHLQLGPNDCFVDLGSGSGRLVLGVSLLWPKLRACVGMEVLPELHTLAVEAHRRAQSDPAFLALQLPRSPCRFVLGDAEAPAWEPPPPSPASGDSNEMVDGGATKDPLASATVIFAYSTTWRSEDALHLATPLQTALQKRLTTIAGGGTGVTVITTDKRFREGGGFRVVRQVDVPNPEVWESTAYFHELVPGSGVE